MSAILAKLRLRRGGPDGVAADQTTPAPTATVPRTRFGAWLSRPMTSFHLIIAVAALLVTLGLIMVLSASGVHSYDEDGSPWVIFAKQVLWTIVGLVAFYAALRMPVNVMRRLAFPGFAFTIVLLILVLIPGIGKEANGSRVVRGRRVLHAAVRAGQDRLRDLGRTCWRRAAWNTRRCARCSFRWCPPRCSPCS